MPEAPTATVSCSPESYTLKHLGQLKQVTVLFADLKGSMECWPIAILRLKVLMPPRGDRPKGTEGYLYGNANAHSSPEGNVTCEGDPGGRRFGVDSHELTTRVPSCCSFCF